MAGEGLLLLVRGMSLCRAGEIDRPDPISSLDRVITRSHARNLLEHPDPTRPIVFSSFKNYESEEFKRRVAIHPFQNECQQLDCELNDGHETLP